MTCWSSSSWNSPCATGEPAWALELCHWHMFSAETTAEERSPPGLAAPLLAGFGRAAAAAGSAACRAAQASCGPPWTSASARSGRWRPWRPGCGSGGRAWARSLCAAPPGWTGMGRIGRPAWRPCWPPWRAGRCRCCASTWTTATAGWARRCGRCRASTGSTSPAGAAATRT